MKYFGCILEFTSLRNQDIMRAYRYLVSSMQVIKAEELGKRLVELPSARFWISEERAAVVISQIMRGKDPLAMMRPAKREMFLEIFRRYSYLSRKMPSAKPLDIVEAVINSPAPKFYLAPRTAIEIIYKIKSGFYERYCKQARYKRNGNSE